MSEPSDTSPHRVGSGPLHPAVGLSVHLAHQLHAARQGQISKGEFENLFRSASADGAWREHSITLQTAALMVATALQFALPLEQRASLITARSPVDPATLATSEHTQLTIATIQSLCALVDEFGGGLRS